MWLKRDFLNGRFDSEVEYQFYLEGLLKKVEDGEELTIDERNEFCHSINRVEKEKYDICKDSIFRSMFLEHFTAKFENRSLSFRERNKIREYGEEWKEVIETENHSNELLKQLSKETRNEIKEFKSAKGIQGKEKISSLNEISIKEIILHSRWIYIITNLIFERLGREFVEVEIDGKEIHIDHFGIVHLMTRHFAQLLKQYAVDKSCFTNEIMTYELVNTLQSILESIHKSKLLAGKDILKITIEYKGKLYRIYLKEVTKQKPGIGNYQVLRVNTFYPIEKAEEVKAVKEMTKVKLNDDLSIFILNTLNP